MNDGKISTHQRKSNTLDSCIHKPFFRKGIADCKFSEFYKRSIVYICRGNNITTIQEEVINSRYPSCVFCSVTDRVPLRINSNLGHAVEYKTGFTYTAFGGFL